MQETANQQEADAKRLLPSIQSVEGAVWAAFSASWLSLRLYIGGARLDAWIVAPTASFAVVTLVLSAVLPLYVREFEKKFFQHAFGAWLASVSLALDAATSKGAQQAFLADPWLSVASVALSAAFATVQMLAAAGAAGNAMFAGQGGLWVDSYFLLVTAAQACAFRSSQPGAAALIIAFNVMSVWGLGARMWKLPEHVSVGAVSLHAFLEIARYALHVVTLITAAAAAYLADTTTFGLLVLSVPGLAAGALQLAQAVRPAEQVGAGSSEPSAPTEEVIARTNQGEMAARATQGEITARVTQGDMAARLPQGDALLFARTRTLTARAKKAL